MLADAKGNTTTAGDEHSLPQSQGLNAAITELFMPHSQVTDQVAVRSSQHKIINEVKGIKTTPSSSDPNVTDFLPHDL